VESSTSSIVDGCVVCVSEVMEGDIIGSEGVFKDCLSDNFVGRGDQWKIFASPSPPRVAISEIEIDLSDAERSQDESISQG